MELANNDIVTARRGTINLPTYAVTGQNRNPVFRSQYGVAHIYPYTLLDEIAPTASEVSYSTLEIENRYLRVTVLPELGGRVYSVYDKISEREVFYKNAVVKFSPLAIRGAFFSGGVEFSFPVAHAPTTADAVNWDLRQNEDGSASISVGGLEHISGLRWMITLTLFPGRCALSQDVHLFNSTCIPGRYHYWTNASVDADDQLEFIYPLRRARSYEYAGTASWPSARLDLVLKDPGLPGMEGVPMWPAERMHERVNFRWQKNMLAQVSIFGRDVAWDFFGAWRHSVNHGYAHCATARDVAGMKLWSWGNAPVGVVNQTALTDDGSEYAETQCGAMETQLDFDFLPPGKTRSWREWWLPLRGLGGLTCASVELGARLQLTPSPDGNQVTVNLGLCPVRLLQSAQVKLTIPGTALLIKKADALPEHPWKTSVIIDAQTLTDHPFTLTVTDSDGCMLLDYTVDRDPNSIEPVLKPNPARPKTAEDYYQLGLHHENFDNREQAEQAYLTALELDPHHAQTNLRYGLMRMRAADFTAAENCLYDAAESGLGEANTYRGIVKLFLGHYDDAETSFLCVPSGSPGYAAALEGLGRIALNAGDWDQAANWFRKAVERSDPPISARLLLGIALRRAGKQADAEQEVLQVLEVTPLNHPALRELSFGQDGQAYQEKLVRMLSEDHQSILDLATFYMQVGLWAEALQLLEDVAKSWDYAMLYYLAGLAMLRLGLAKEAALWFERGAQASPEFVFPSRLEEVQALQAALQENAQDSNAQYFLGNFLYAHGRYEEGKQLWEQALQGLAALDVLHRNLGLAYWQRENDLGKATGEFELALKLNPLNYDLYLLLDDVYKTQGEVEQRLDLLERIKSLTEPREDLRKRKVAMMVDLGQVEAALELMTGEVFIPLEMDQSFHDLYVRAWLMKADAHLQTGQVQEAIHDYQQALLYPENLGVGAPTTQAQAEIYYRIGCAYEKLGLYRQALDAWQQAAREHHPHGHSLYEYVQKSLDKLCRYSELGLEP
jgi:tetratricopeptide (TPR) repeat protein